MFEEIVSVIVCTYNQEHTIARTLDAIIGQDSPLPIEVIIGDDCSRDGTADVCQRYADLYPMPKDGEPLPKVSVKLFSWKENKGVLDNYYTCVRKAHGMYLMECGGDDEWCPGRIRLCLDIMRQHPDVVQVFTDVWFRVEATGSVRPSGRYVLPEGVIDGRTMLDLMFHENPRTMSSFAMTRRDKILELMDSYPRFFSGREWQCEDKQLKTLMATKGNVYSTKVCTYYYDIDTPSITHTPNYQRRYKYAKSMIRLNHALAKAVGYNRLKLVSLTWHFLVRMAYWKCLGMRKKL